MNALVRAVLYAMSIELPSLPIAMLRIGHAGPEGPFATFGWVGLLVNLPGFLIAGGLAPFDSQLNFAICVFFVQMSIFSILFYVIGKRGKTA